MANSTVVDNVVSDVVIQVLLHRFNGRNFLDFSFLVCNVSDRVCRICSPMVSQHR